MYVFVLGGVWGVPCSLVTGWVSELLSPITQALSRPWPRSALPPPQGPGLAQGEQRQMCWGAASLTSTSTLPFSRRAGLSRESESFLKLKGSLFETGLVLHSSVIVG